MKKEVKNIYGTILSDEWKVWAISNAEATQRAEEVEWLKSHSLEAAVQADLDTQSKDYFYLDKLKDHDFDLAAVGRDAGVSEKVVKNRINKLKRIGLLFCKVSDYTQTELQLATQKGYEDLLRVIKEENESCG